MTSEPVKTLTDTNYPSLSAMAYKFVDWLITLLQFYIVISIAMVGWIFTTKPAWSDFQKGIIIAIYVGAVSTNFVWIFRLQGWLKNVLTEIKEVANGQLSSPSPVIQIITQRASSNLWWWPLLAVHVGGAVFVVYCIWCLTSNFTK